MKRLLLVALAGLAACSMPAGTDSTSKLQIVTSVSPITNLTDNLAGADAEIHGIIPEGVSSHSYEPPPSAVRRMREADLVFLNGLGLEESILKALERNKKTSAEIVVLAETAVEESEWIFDASFPRERGHPNPHLWTSPVYGLRYSEAIRETLSARLDGGELNERFDTLKAKIEALDKAVRDSTSTVPAERRKLLTYHDSFPYFAKTYGWTVIGAAQPSDFSEPTARDIANLIDQIRREQLPAVFGSEVFPSKILERIASETRALYVDELRDDDLPGERGDARHSYLGLLQFDFVTIVEALGGDAAALKSLDVSNFDRERATYER